MVPPTEPWAASPHELAAALETDLQRGLTEVEAVRRLRELGPNVIGEIQHRSRLVIFIDQFRSLLVVLLAAAAAISLVFAQWVEAGAVFAVLIINGLIGFLTELRAVRSMEALRQLGVATAVVRRDGHRRLVDSRELVVGDLVIVEGGDHIGADMRVIEASRLQANESLLTGEAVPVGKRVEAIAGGAEIGDRRSMLFRGTSVTRGAGVGLVTATALATEVGRISQLAAEAEPEETPLERRLNKLGQALVWVTLLLAAAIGVLGLAQGAALATAIQTAIALAVASVPEGLPIIATLALARGMHKMVARNALINRLSAVETLGATSIVCTDKTGTLTENQMTVVLFDLVGAGVVLVAEEIDREAAPGLEQALRIGVLCNDGSLDGDGIGDPLEVALLRVAARAGMGKASVRAEAPRVREIAFDPEVKMMATVHELETGDFVFAVKGAPESVLAACTSDSSGQPLTEAARREWQAKNLEHGGKGLRLLGLATKTASSRNEEPYQGLVWLGLVGLQDPPRTDAIRAVREVQDAGLRLVMVTGDQPATARTIAEEIGFRGAVTAELGTAIEGWRDRDRVEQDRLADVAVFARVSPAQKLELVALHQSRGAVVAMTGDGVNDAPALRKADIGIAMGRRGTAVAREAAEMVLLDDSFASIVEAIREGRAIFANIRAFVVYLLSCNLSEIMVVGLATLLGGGLPLLPLQILFLNLVTDVFPALALGANAGDPSAMKRPPRPAGESIVGRQQWIVIALFGAVMTASVLAAFFVAREVLGYDQAGAVGVSFVAIALAQLVHVFNMRPASSHWLHNEVVANHWVWGAVLLCLALVAGAVYVPPLATVLQVRPPGADGWIVIAGAALATWLLGQLVVRLRQR